MLSTLYSSVAAYSSSLASRLHCTSPRLTSSISARSTYKNPEGRLWSAGQKSRYSIRSGQRAATRPAMASSTSI